MSELAVLPPHRSGVGWLVAGAAGLSGFVVLTVIVVLTGGRDALDLGVSQSVVTIRTDTANRFASQLTNLGSFPVVATAAVLISLFLRWWTQHWLRPAVLVCAVTITASVVYLMKIAVGRARPATDILIGTPSLDYSFPSGHTTDGSVVWLAAAVLVALPLRRRTRRALMVAAGVLVAVIVGLTRVYLGYHWATDVIAGWCLAGAVVCVAGYVCTRATQRTTGVDPVRRDAELAPVVVSGRTPR